MLNWQNLLQFGLQKRGGLTRKTPDPLSPAGLLVPANTSSRCAVPDGTPQAVAATVPALMSAGGTINRQVVFAILLVRRIDQRKGAAFLLGGKWTRGPAGR